MVIHFCEAAMGLMESVGYLAMALSMVCILPQAAKTFRTKEWRGNADWKPTSEDTEYFNKFPQGEVF